MSNSLRSNPEQETFIFYRLTMIGHNGKNKSRLSEKFWEVIYYPFPVEHQYYGKGRVVARYGRIGSRGVTQSQPVMTLDALQHKVNAKLRKGYEMIESYNQIEPVKPVSPKIDLLAMLDGATPEDGNDARPFVTTFRINQLQKVFTPDPERVWGTSNDNVYSAGPIAIHAAMIMATKFNDYRDRALMILRNGLKILTLDDSTINEGLTVPETTKEDATDFIAMLADVALGDEAASVFEASLVA